MRPREGHTVCKSVLSSTFCFPVSSLLSPKAMLEHFNVRENIKRGQSKFAPKFIEPLTASSQEGGLKVKGDPQHCLEVLKSGVLGRVVDTCRAVSQH